MPNEKEPIPRPETAGAVPAPEEKEGFAGDLYAWLQALTFALLLLMIIFTFFGRIIGVDGSSMLPTLTNGDLLFLQCAGYEPEQGDVVVLHKSFAATSEPIVKRVVATGGQTVHIDYGTGTVYVDGEALDEPYLGEPMLQPGSASMQETDWDIPEGSVFVMGDNRNNSADSRESSLGPVDSDYVLGKALDEPYLGEPMLQPGSPNMQQTDWDVPEDSVFVMGDNRNHSADSREDSLGPVDSDYVLGKALVVLFPFSHFGSIH